MIRSLTRGSILGVLLLMMSAVPSLAADMTDTEWDLDGRERTWVRSVGRDFTKASATMYFAPAADSDDDGTLEPATWELVIDDYPDMPLTGTWSDWGGRRFGGEVDESVFVEALKAFLADMYGVETDAVMVNLVRNRMKGHLNRDGDRMKMKLRFKGDLEIDSPEGPITRRAWIKMRLRGKLVTPDPDPEP
jgi:hypothetical protein